MLISLAENAVKHGVEPKIGAACIEVRAQCLDGARLRLSVLDNGVGFGGAGGVGGSAAGSGLGLANLRERLAQLHGSQAKLTLEARASGGVAATLELPLEFDETKE